MQKGFAPIILLVGILMIAVVAGGAFYLQSKEGSLHLGTIKPQPTLTPFPTPSNEKCVVGGCSGQLCLQVTEGQDDQIVSTCEYREEYGCYKTAKCEKQSDGKCGWTKTEELTKCLKEKSTTNIYQ